MNTVEVKEPVYLGSSADDSVGVGYMIRGSEYRRTEDGYELLCLDGEWIEVFDVIRVSSMGIVNITWVD